MELIEKFQAQPKLGFPRARKLQTFFRKRMNGGGRKQGDKCILQHPLLYFDTPILGRRPTGSDISSPPLSSRAVEPLTFLLKRELEGGTSHAFSLGDRMAG